MTVFGPGAGGHAFKIKASKLARIVLAKHDTLRLVQVLSPVQGYMFRMHSKSLSS